MRSIYSVFALLTLMLGTALAQPVPVIASNPVGGVGVPTVGMYCMDSSGNAQICSFGSGGGGGAVTESGTWQVNLGYGGNTVSSGNPLGVSVLSSVLPTGAATAANQVAPTVAGTSASSATPVQGVTGGVALPVSIASMPSTPVTGVFWQATQPVSGTVSLSANTPTLQAGTANIGVTGVAQGTAIGSTYGELLQAETLTGNPSYTTSTIDPLTMTLAGGLRVVDINMNLTQGSSTSGQLGPIVQAAASTTNPSYTTATTDPFSQTLSGMLRVILQNGNNTVAQSFSSGTAASNGGIGASGIYLTTPLALTTGQSAGLTTDVTSALYANTEGQRASYRCTAIIVPAATPTDVFGIIGSSTKTVKIHAIYLSTFATTAGEMTVQIAKRSTADGAGNSTPTTIPLDSSDAAGTAVCKNFTANPTTGTLVAYVDTGLLPFPTAALGTPTRTLFDYGTRATQALVLRGVAQEVDINLAGGTLPSGASLAATIEWSEE